MVLALQNATAESTLRIAGIERLPLVGSGERIVYNTFETEPSITTRTAANAITA